ncbi:SurA N-terminal domain-containing protein [Streptacidiphilus sp. EB129]|uniref:SurA N-terminal domain-containing protein n=1 Tax=Streptacidiphilus sp. EB129 TaxID=3156262 RepID=UPI00351242DC
MNRRRTAAAVLAVCAVGALSACSGTAHPGAAAVVGDQRITESALQAHVSAYRAAAVADGQAAQEPAGVPAQTLSLLVASQIVDQTLSAHGLAVTEGEVQQAEAADVRQLGGAQALQQDFVSKLSLAPSDVDLYYRFKLGEVKLLQQAGVDLNGDQTAVQASLQKLLEQASSSVGVTVNPRYGSWNAATLAMVAADQPWLKPTAPAQS